MSRPGSAAVLPVFISICLCAFSANVAGSQEPDTAGVIKGVAGAAFVVRAGREMPATLGQRIFQGDTLRTSADGRLGATLKDGTRLSLGGDTEIRIDAFSYAPAQGHLALALKLLRGAAAYISGRIAQLAPGAVKVETPTSVIGIRGTHVLIGVDQP